jgi:hypothetical protein
MADTTYAFLTFHFIYNVTPRLCASPLSVKNTNNSAQTSGIFRQVEALSIKTETSVLLNAATVDRLGSQQNKEGFVNST